jgi:hypothetical protein
MRMRAFRVDIDGGGSSNRFCQRGKGVDYVQNEPGHSVPRDTMRLTNTIAGGEALCPLVA